MARWLRYYGWDLALAAAALALIAIALTRLLADEAGVTREQLVIGKTPATLYRPAQEDHAGPVVIVSHGFAGARPLMDPYSLTLAQNGYTALSFDYLGHGRNPRPLYGDITDQDGAAQALVDQTAEIAAYARRELEAGERGLALLGHSMATNIIVRYAQQDEEVAATVGISLFAPTVDAETPGNLLSVVGGLEGQLEEEGRKIVAMAAGIEPEAVELGRTYGDMRAGDARRVAIAPGVEHVGVLYSEAAQREALSWLNAAFERESEGWVSERGPAVALLLAAVIVLARPASRLLPRVEVSARGAGGGWQRIAWVAGVPALATPVLLSPLPTDFLPVVIADYVAVHFAVFGLLSAVLLWWTGGRPSLAGVLAAVRPASGWRMALGVAGLLVYCLGVLGIVFDQFVTVFFPVWERWPLILVMLAGTLPYFLADEWLTRGVDSRRGSYPVTKLLFLLSLGIAVALDWEGLFFLLMIVPVILVFFLVYGLFSRWVYQRTAHPLVAGLGNAVAFAWALGVTFPMLGGAPGS
ncbi:MAG: alpha/beta fold hydrolase [Halorhodospira sp.]